MNMLNKVKEFATIANIQVDPSYIDRFFFSFYDDQWIQIDKTILTWIGYVDIKVAVRNFQKKLSKEFTLNTDYKYLTKEQVEASKIEYITWEIPCLYKDETILVVQPDSFKRILLSMKTDKAIHTQNSFIAVERLCRAYMKQYVAAAANKVIPQAIEELTLNETVYVISSNQYAAQSMYKIGRTSNLKTRLPSLNTAHPDTPNERLKVFYNIKCYDSKTFEALIHKYLNRYRHSDTKEWFQIEWHRLKLVLDYCSVASQELVQIINHINPILNPLLMLPNTTHVKQILNESQHKLLRYDPPTQAINHATTDAQVQATNHATTDSQGQVTNHATTDAQVQATNHATTDAQVQATNRVTTDAQGQATNHATTDAQGQATNHDTSDMYVKNIVYDTQDTPDANKILSGKVSDKILRHNSHERHGKTMSIWAGLFSKKISH